MPLWGWTIIIHSFITSAIEMVKQGWCHLPLIGWWPFYILIEDNKSMATRKNEFDELYLAMSKNSWNNKFCVLIRTNNQSRAEISDRQMTTEILKPSKTRDRTLKKKRLGHKFKANQQSLSPGIVSKRWILYTHVDHLEGIKLYCYWYNIYSFLKYGPFPHL